MIRGAYRKPKCSRALVFKWHGRFVNGRSTVTVDERFGRSPSLWPKFTTMLKEILDADRRLTVKALSEDLDISTFKVHKILTEDLHTHKVSARWVPIILIEEQKRVRVEQSTNFQRRYESKGQYFLDRTKCLFGKLHKLHHPRRQKSKDQVFIFFIDRNWMSLQH